MAYRMSFYYWFLRLRQHWLLITCNVTPCERLGIARWKTFGKSVLRESDLAIGALSKNVDCLLSLTQLNQGRQVINPAKKQLRGQGGKSGTSRLISLTQSLGNRLVRRGHWF